MRATVGTLAAVGLAVGCGGASEDGGTGVGGTGVGGTGGGTAGAGTSQPTGATGSEAPPVLLGPAAGTASDPAGNAEWPTFGHDLGAQRANGFVEDLGPAEVASLAVAWELDGLRAVTGTPAVVEGTVYATDWTPAVRALDAADGTPRWVTPLPASAEGSVHVTDDAVYVAAGRTTLRLDRSTGNPVWSTEVDDHPWTRLYGSPIVVPDGDRDLVIQPVAGVQIAAAQEDYDFRGKVVALDADTGQQVWQVAMTADDETSGAGVSVWSAPSADPDRGLLFVGTGNTYEEPTSPWADAVVALRLATGEIAWTTQFTNPDVYNMPQANGAEGPDADVGSTPMLWSVGDTDLVGVGDKAGVFHALDRDTGSVRWERQLTPGSRLGGMIGGAAYADGRIFVASNVGNPDSGVPTGESILFALDAGTGETLWQAPLELSVFGPATVAAGVVYQGTGAPRYYAFDAVTGDELWRHDPPAPVGGGAAVVEGRVFWGYGYWVVSPPEDPAGGLLVFAPDL